jgi:GH43 family beta-xylosidase
MEYRLCLKQFTSLNMVLTPVWFFMLVFLSVSCSEQGMEKEDIPIDPGQPPIEDSSTFRNPVLNAAPDPWVIKNAGEYFVTFTTGFNITLMRTRNMSDLKNAMTKVIWTPPATGMNSKEIWAPELHRMDGKWYVYYAASDGNNENHKMWILENTSSDPFEGAWIDKGELELPDDKWAIDGSPLELNGKYYYAWSGWEGDVNVRQDIYLAEMQDPLTVIGERVAIVKPIDGWETNNTNPQVTEGPQFLKRNGKVFLFYSAGGCWTDGYSIGALWMDEQEDPLEKSSWTKLESNPLFVSNPTGNAFGPGHNSFFKSLDNQEDWVFYHANPQAGLGCADQRSARMQKISWDAEGFPVLGIPEPLNKDLKKPGGEY